MAVITLTLSAAHLTRAVDALAVRFGYSATLEGGGANPQSKNEFVRLRVGQWIRDEVREHELATARSAVTVSQVDIT